MLGLPVAVSMFAYMTEIETVDIVREEVIEAEGDDMMSLLFHFLDESLFLMCGDPYFIVKEVEIIEFDTENFKIKAIERGEEFDLKKHPQGTEVKAITYSSMQIYDHEGMHEVFVIIDI
ncbi:hypothetical protein QZH41_014014 [Actinostola sp. cb2023]|nr:hypothetical protein QZH41_014014 [Actinostola sp. cb2023]